jgi:hypothetical protein
LSLGETFRIASPALFSAYMAEKNGALKVDLNPNDLTFFLQIYE